MYPSPSLRARALTWLLWRLPFKSRWTDTLGLRDRVLKSRQSMARPPLSLRRRYRCEETTHAGHPVYRLRPRKGIAAKHILYLHGGAYVYDIAPVQWSMLGKLMQLSAIEVTVPLYPLAPESSCEETLRWTAEVYRDTLQHTGGLPLVLLGDSAGAGLALALSQLLRDTAAPLPAAQVLISPWLDVTCSDPSQEKLEIVDPLLGLPGLRQAGRWYAGTLDPADPRVSPLFGDLGGLPPTLALTGTYDVLYPDVLRLQSRVANTSALLTVIEAPRMLHVWPAMPIPEARLALRQIASFLDGLGS